MLSFKQIGENGTCYSELSHSRNFQMPTGVVWFPRQPIIEYMMSGWLWIKFAVRLTYCPLKLILKLENFGVLHYSDVIMSSMASQITSLRLFTQPFVQMQIKENINALHHWPLWGEFTGDWWIPCTNGQYQENFISWRHHGDASLEDFISSRFKSLKKNHVALMW